MPLVIPPGHFQVAFHFTQVGSGQEAITTIGAQGPDPINPVEAASFEDPFAASVLPLVTSDWVHDKVTWSSAEGTVRETFLSNAGDELTAALIGAVAILVHKRTARPGRQGRGRMFIPGPGEGAVDGTGMLTAGRLADWQGAMDAWFLAVNTNSDYNMVLLHNEAVPPAVAPAPDVINGLDVSPKCGIQRRRLRG